MTSQSDPRIVRVGEGHYTPMNKIPPKYKDEVDRVLRSMRQITYKLTIKQEEEEQG